MNNNELYHYGIKGMRWKDHKYKAIKNGKRIYDIVKYNLGGQARKDYKTSHAKYKISDREYRQLGQAVREETSNLQRMKADKKRYPNADSLEYWLKYRAIPRANQARQERTARYAADKRYNAKSFNALAKRGQQRWSAEARETVDALKTKVRTGKSNFRKKRRKVKRAITKARRSYTKLYNKYAQQARTNGVGKTYAQAFKDGFKDGQAKYYKKHKTNR